MVARGALELIWEGCYESGEDYLGTASDIEDSVKWKGEPGALTQALADAGAPDGDGFIEIVSEINGEHTYKVHDLWHHAPDYVQKRHRREVERRQRVAPTAKRRRTAPNGSHRPPSRDSQTGVVLPPSPSPSPSPALAPSPAQNTETRLAPLRMSPPDLVTLWNATTTPPLPQCSKLTDERTRKAHVRLREHPDPAYWRAVVERIQVSDFCRGLTGGTWVATFDWLIKSADNPIRVMEGKYDNRAGAPARHQHATKGAANMAAADEAFEAIYGQGIDDAPDQETDHRRVTETRGTEVAVARPSGDRRH